MYTLTYDDLHFEWKDEALGYTPSVSRNKNTIEEVTRKC